MLDDKQPSDVGTIHVRVNALYALPSWIAGRNLLATFQLQNRAASTDRPRREHAIDVSVCMGLRRRREK